MDGGRCVLGKVAEAGTGNAQLDAETGIVATGPDQTVTVTSLTLQLTDDNVITTDSGNVVLTATAGAL